MTTELDRQISREEIDWVKSKHEGIHKGARRMLNDAFELGQWFIEAAVRMGIELKTGKRNPDWTLWLRATFPEMHRRTIQRYIRLAGGRDYLLETDLRHESQDDPLTIDRGLRLLTARDREIKEKEEPDQPLAEFEEPLQILADQLKGYVYEMFRIKYLEDQIKFRIKNAGLGRRQVRQALEWACREHTEIKDVVMDVFLK